MLTKRHASLLTAVTGALALITGIFLALGVPGRPATPHLAKGVDWSADFAKEKPPAEVRQVANGVVRSQDAGNKGFILLDKKHTRLYVFDRNGSLRGASPVLIGAAVGDDSAPGIGNRPLNQVKQQEKTTPAGRFVGERGHDDKGGDLIWVDYDAAVSMHRVIDTGPAEHRLQRLASPSTDDNRISFGCINVPPAFYDTYVSPLFSVSRANVYILPDTKSVQEVFNFTAKGNAAAPPGRRAAS